MAGATKSRGKTVAKPARGAVTPVNGGAILSDFSTLLVAASLGLERFKFAGQHGLSYWSHKEGRFKRDLYQVAGYPQDITPEMYRSAYERGGITARIVEAYPKATWVRGVEIREVEDPDEITEFEAAASELFERLGAWNRIRRTDILANLGRYAVLLIGAPGEWSTELTSVRKAEEIAYLTPLGELHAAIEREVDDAYNSRFGLPEYYQVRFSRGARRVHHSRVIHVAEGVLENEALGTPRLQAVWNYLDDLTKNVAGGSEAAWKRADPGMQVDVPLLNSSGQELQLSDAAIAGMREQIEEYEHNLRRTLMTRGTKINLLNSSVSSIASNADALLKLISATTGIPVRILTGSERGELASTQDRSNWADRVSERRDEFGEPVVRQFVDRLIAVGALPEPVDGYEIVWPAIDELTEAEKAELLNLYAQANKAQKEAEGEIIFSADEIRDTVLGRKPLDDESKARVSAPRAAADLANREREEPEWKAVHRVADRRVDQLMAIFVALWLAMSGELEASELDRQLAAGSQHGAYMAADAAITVAEAKFQNRLALALLETLAAGGETNVRSARARGSWLRPAAEFTPRFDEKNPRAISWANQRAAELIKEVGPETREGVREQIVSGLRDGIPPGALAKQIREDVGLLSQQQVWAQNLRSEILAAKPGALITRFPAAPGLRKESGFKVRVPRGGATAEFAEQATNRYKSMHRKLRARTIARTETLRAANAGVRESWRQAQEQGFLPKTQQRVWIATDDEATRRSHRDLDGVVVGIDEAFPTGIEPGQEPNCRCAQGLVRGNEIPTRPAPPEGAEQKSSWSETVEGFMADLEGAGHKLTQAITSFDIGTSVDLASWNRMIGIPPSEFLDRMSGRQGLRFIGGLRVNSSGVTIKGRFVNEASEEVMRLTREFTHTAYIHKELVIAEQYRGIGKFVLREQVELYLDLLPRGGASVINLEANIDAGAYAWARYGFTPSRESWLALRPDIASRLARPGTGLSAEVVAEVNNLLASSNPATIWDIADLRVDVSGVPLGRHLLAGLEWEGGLDLRDKRAMKRLSAYFGGSSANPAPAPREFTYSVNELKAKLLEKHGPGLSDAEFKRRALQEIAEQYSSAAVKVTHTTGSRNWKFTVNGKQHTGAGSYSAQTKTIHIEDVLLQEPFATVTGVMHHECGHWCWDQVVGASRTAGAYRGADVRKVDAFVAKYLLDDKVRARLAKAAATDDFQNFSEYAQSYWQQYAKGGQEWQFELAVNETIAEIRQYRYISGGRRLQNLDPIFLEMERELMELLP